MSKTPKTELVLEDKESTTQEMIQNQDTMPSGEVTPMVMMQMAVQQGAPVEQMERLWELNEKVEAANARKAYFAALAEFKKNPPQVVKDKFNQQYKSTYVSIGNMVNTVSEALGKVGLSTSWEFGEGSDGEIVCTCVMSHAMGHQESVTLSSPVDTSGAKNALQGRKSTRTYLKIETFEAVTGMTSVEANMDDDGNSADVEFISEEQINKLHSRLVENEIPMENFNKWMHSQFQCEDMSGIPAVSFTKVNNKITATIKAMKEKK